MLENTIWYPVKTAFLKLIHFLGTSTGLQGEPDGDQFQDDSEVLSRPGSIADPEEDEGSVDSSTGNNNEEAAVNAKQSSMDTSLEPEQRKNIT